MLATTRYVTATILFLSSACGDDGTHHLPDAPPVPQVTLTVDPPAVLLVPGAMATVTATIDRTNFTGDVEIAGAAMTGDLSITGGTIAADATTVELTIKASGAAMSAKHAISVTGTAVGATIDPAAVAVSVAGLAGMPIPGVAGDQSGYAVSLSADGKRIIIGAPFSDGPGTDAGMARVYERSGNAWTQLGGDLPGEAAGDRYGFDVAMSGDGTHVAVGAYLNDAGGGAAGHVRVFELAGTTWTQLGADIDGAGAGFGRGYSLALSASGQRVIIGDQPPLNVNGRAQVYEYAAGTWTTVGAEILGDHRLGEDVTISDDGMRIAVSSPSAQSSDGAPGKVQVYAWNGTAWAPLGAALVGAQANAYLGKALAFSADASLLAIGSSESDGGGMNTGDVRVFRWDNTAWTQVGAALTGPVGSKLGTSVAISGDGTRLLAGGPLGAGTARLFTRTGDTWSAPIQIDGGSTDQVGLSVALSRDGKTAAVGAPFADAPGNQSGRVILHDLP